MLKPSITLALLAAFALNGCVAKTAFNVATAPIRAGAKVADWATTSEDEADRARGREIRRREEQLGDLQEDLAELEDDCLSGDDRACREAVSKRQEIEALLPSIPVEPAT